MAINIQNRRKHPTLPTPRLRFLVRTICDGLGFSKVEVSVVITDDPGIHELNRTWRNKDKPTDVLSFSQVEGEIVVGSTAVLGDVIISADTAARQAEHAGLTLDQEFQRLLVHGMLHLLGHDHVHGGHQARKMKLEEARLLRLLRRADRAYKQK